MKTTAQEYKAIVVAETDQLQEMACAAVQELGKKLGNERSVDALVKRFAKTIASDP